MKLLVGFLQSGTVIAQLQRGPEQAIPASSEEIARREDWKLDPLVQVRWDFGDCGKTGMNGPTVEECSEYYFDTNLEGSVRVEEGVQQWVVPADGLYLVTAGGPAGSSVSAGGRGRGAILEGNFHLMKGEIIDIVVGQITDYNLSADPNSRRGLGGSGGTFVVRNQDNKILMAAGGGGGGAGRKANVGLTRNVNDATEYPYGQNASIPLSGKGGRDDLGVGGQGGLGGSYGPSIIGFDGTRKFGGGGGAGFGNMTGGTEDGGGAAHPSELGIDSRGAINFLSVNRGMNSKGTGGFIQFKPKGSRLLITNNGGFGGGGYGSEDGGAGGGGGYSGGAGGPPDGYSGGGGSLNNGLRQRNDRLNDGRGFVTISFIGKQCCGPRDVYVAMAFIAGILAKLLVTYFAYWAWRTAKRMHTSYVIINHLKELRRENQKLDADETLLIGRILEQEEDLKSRIGASRPDLRRRLSGRKRTHYDSESYTTTDQTSNQYTDRSRTVMSASQSESGTVITARRLSSESDSSASTVVKQPVTQSMAASQAFTNVTQMSKISNHGKTEADSVLGGATFKSRSKLDGVNKSTRSGIYSTIGRNAVMPEEDEEFSDEDEDIENDEEEDELSERSSPIKSLAKSNMSLAKSQRSAASGFQSRLSRPGTTIVSAARSARSVATSEAPHASQARTPAPRDDDSIGRSYGNSISKIFKSLSELSSEFIDPKKSKDRRVSFLDLTSTSASSSSYSTSISPRVISDSISDSSRTTLELDLSMSKSQMTLTEDDPSVSQLSLSESQYSRTYQSGSEDGSYSQSYRSQSEYTENSQYRV